MIHRGPGQRTGFATTPRPAAEPVKRYEFQARIGFDDKVIKRADTIEECCEAIKERWPRLDKWARGSTYVERPSAIDLGCPRGLTEGEQQRVRDLLAGLYR